MNIKKIVGLNIKKYRKNLGKTQEQLSELIDVTSKHLSKVEQGQRFPSPELIEKLSIALKISPPALFYSTEFDNFDESVASKVDNIIKETMLELRNKVREKL